VGGQCLDLRLPHAQVGAQRVAERQPWPVGSAFGPVVEAMLGEIEEGHACGQMPDVSAQLSAAQLDALFAADSWRGMADTWIDRVLARG